MENLSRRKKIIEILKSTNKPLTAREIARLLNISPRDLKVVYEDLRHIARTLKRTGGGREKLEVYPPYCANCGFIFTKRERLKKPSRCPRCKSERIVPPRFIIRSRAK